VPAEASRLIEPGDRAALTAALTELIGDGALRARLSSAARAHAERLSDWPAATAHWMAAVERLAAVEALCA
jgi:glycosyltransferase involved in cell wall biosynthesis